MPTIWSVILTRKDQLLQKFWTEWRVNVVTQSAGSADAGSIPMLGPGGKLDASMIPPPPAPLNALVVPPPPPITVTLTTGENINSFQVVAVHSDGLAYKASSGDINDVSRVAGVAITSGLTGQTVRVEQVGMIVNTGWSFTPGSTVYLGLNGALVQSPNTGVFELPMGVAVSASQLEEQIGMPIIFA